MFTVQRKVGRLVEARVLALGDAQEVRAYADAFGPLLRSATDAPVLCADHRPVVIYTPDVADLLVELFKSLNTRWERAALVVAPTNATLAMQLQRIVRESAGSTRRVFLEPRGALEFVGEVLNPTELARANVFLGGP